MAKKEMYIRREHYLDILDKNLISLKTGKGKNVAFLGPRKCGKTLLVKEHLKGAKDVVSVYMDFGRISLNPENFSIEFIGNIVHSFLKKPISELKDFFSLPKIISEENAISQGAFSHVQTIENELLKIKPDQRLLVQLAFDFAGKWAHESGKKFLIVLDNFENVLDLNNFSAIGNVLEIVNLSGKNVSYVATSSSVRQMLELLSDFECYEIKNLDKNETAQLVLEISGNSKIADAVFEIGKGHPLVTSIISKKFNETKDVNRAYLSSLLWKKGELYHYCEDSYNFYYNKARGQTLLRTILKIIANEELRLSDIARKVHRSAPVAKSILERLIAVDIIHKKDGKFYFSDSVISLWIKLTTSGYDFDDIDDAKIEEAMRAL